VSEKPTPKTESHITTLPREIDQNLAIALGEMVVAFGRLEYMFKVVIKRLEQKRTLEEVIKAFSGGSGTLGKLIDHCRKNSPSLNGFCNKAVQLNTDRQDFIHATFAATEEGRYVRFRKLIGYGTLSNDIERIKEITNNANSLIEELDHQTGSLVANTIPSNETIATVSAPISRI
jgi:hypothetical protein